MRTPSPSWCGLDRTHLWPTGSSLGDPLITARNFSSCLSDSISRWTPCPPEAASGGFRSALAVSDFRLRARLDISIPSTSPASEAFNPAFGYGAPHPSAGGTSTLLINALLSTHHGPIRDSRPTAFLGYPRGHRVETETRCRSTQGLTTYSILSLEPECLKNPISISRVDPRGWNELFVRDAQAACVFRCSASKCAPFFQMIRVIAAILRASVSRAIEGLIPLASKAW